MTRPSARPGRSRRGGTRARPSRRAGAGAARRRSGCGRRRARGRPRAPRRRCPAAGSRSRASARGRRRGPRRRGACRPPRLGGEGHRADQLADLAIGSASVSRRSVERSLVMSVSVTDGEVAGGFVSGRAGDGAKRVEPSGRMTPTTVGPTGCPSRNAVGPGRSPGRSAVPSCARVAQAHVAGRTPAELVERAREEKLHRGVRVDVARMVVEHEHADLLRVEDREQDVRQAVNEPLAQASAAHPAFSRSRGFARWRRHDVNYHARAVWPQHARRRRLRCAALPLRRTLRADRRPAAGDRRARRGRRRAATATRRCSA